MPLNRLFLLIASAILGMLAVNTALFFVVQRSQADLAQAQTHRQDSLALMYAMQQEDERLSRLVQAYAHTGQSRYLFYYYDILAIREGRKAPPSGLSQSYWDRVIAGQVVHRMPEGGNLRSLAQRMADLKFDRAELDAMRRVMAISEEMKSLEQVAFASLQGLYDPERKAFISEGVPRPEHAREILYGDEYSRVRARLSDAMEQLAKLVDSRTSSELFAAQQYARSWIVVALLSMVLTLLMVLLVIRSLRRRIQQPMAELHHNAMRLAAGGYDARVGTLVDSVKEMTDLARTFDGMAGAIQADIAQREAVQADLEEARKRAESATQAKTLFLANMSHEIRTPMNAILGMTHLALNTPMTPQQRDYIDKAHGAAKTLLGIINDILDVSKMESGKLTLESVSFELEQVVSNALFLVHHRAQEKGIELLLDIGFRLDGREAMPVGDPLRLGQVLVNLLTNAVKFTEHGHVRLTVGAHLLPGERVGLEFSVEDTGIGMTETQLAGLFQDFAQADASTTRKYGGTGLGLAISKRLVGLMDGRLEVSSRPGQGSCFHFGIELPMSGDQVPGANGIADPAGLRVLLVDDYAMARETLAGLLASMGFMHVDQAADGAEALEKLHIASGNGEPYELLLLDWLMPGMDGPGVLREIAARRLALPGYVVIVSAWESAGIWTQARELGATHVLEKPVLPAGLRRCLGPVGQESGARDGLAEEDGLAGLNVLLVEDNPINQQIAREIMRKWAVNVDTAANGRDALDRLAGKPDDFYALVLMDIQMPVMDGLEATRRIRAEARHSDLPLVAMTAHAMAEEREHCLALGMNGHLAKPFEAHELRDCLRRHARRGSQRQLPGRTAGVDALPEAATLPSLPGLDAASAVRRMDNDSALYLHLLADFARDNAGTVEQLRERLGAGDLDGVTRLAHTLKGLAGTFGFTPLEGPAARLEQAARDGQPGLETNVNEVDAVLAPALLGLKTFFACQTPAADPEAAPGSDASNGETLLILRRFVRYLENADGEALEIWQASSEALQRCFTAHQAREISRAMDRYDFDTAGREARTALEHCEGDHYG